MTKREALKCVKLILSRSISDHGEAVIVTTNSNGQPHASWMGTLNSPNISTLITMTSPDSRKVINLLENPKVEWMFTNRSRTQVAYLRGKARIVQDPQEVEEAWKSLKNKTKAYFMQYSTEPGMPFLVIKTNVEEIELVVPKDNIHKTLRPPFRG